jgi:F0F1-type ATP synthase assembly protein I
MSFISKLLPTIGNLLGGPLGAAALDAAGKALGISDAAAVEKTLTGGNLTTDQIAALQAADMQLKTRMAELGIDAEKLAAEDRASARAMQTATDSWVPSVLACVVTVGFFGILVGLLTGWLKLWESTTLSLLIGTLSGAFTSVLAFFYGASHKPEQPKK